MLVDFCTFKAQEKLEFLYASVHVLNNAQNTLADLRMVLTSNSYSHPSHIPALIFTTPAPILQKHAAPLHCHSPRNDGNDRCNDS